MTSGIAAAAPVAAPRSMPSTGSLSWPVKRTYSAASVRMMPIATGAALVNLMTTPATSPAATGVAHTSQTAASSVLKKRTASRATNAQMIRTNVRTGSVTSFAEPQSR